MADRLATPIAWYTILFVLVGIGTMIFALLTISIQIIKATLLNQVKPLRSE